jgi:hypothetical protein
MAACGGSDDGAQPTAGTLAESVVSSLGSRPIDSTVAPQVPPDTEPPVSTTEATTTTSVAVAAEQGIVLCNQEQMSIARVGVVTGQVTELGQVRNHSSFTGDFANGEFIQAMSPIGLYLCRPDSDGLSHQLWNADFTEFVIVRETGDSRGVFTVPLDGDPQLFVELEGETDFGGGPATAMSAAFLPDGERIIWQENKDGVCRTYIAPSAAPVGRAMLPDLLVSERDGCGTPSNTRFRSIGGADFFCINECYDVYTNQPYEVQLPSVETIEVPESSRFQIDPPNRIRGSDGTIFFVADDFDSGESFLYSWGGEGTEPAEMVRLGAAQDNWRIVAMTPAP